MEVSNNFQQCQFDIIFPLNDYSWYSFLSSYNTNTLTSAGEFLQLSLVQASN